MRRTNFTRPGAAVFCAIFLLAGCVMDSVVSRQEGEIRAASREIRTLELRLQSLKAETAKLAVKAGPEAIAQKRVELERDLESVGLRVTARGPELVVTLAQTILFDPGCSDVRDSAKDAMLTLAKAVRKRFPERNIRVEGHTDATRPNKVAQQYPTNWELSAARALAVLRFLVDEGDLPRDQVCAAAYGQHRPLRDNSTAEGRDENRRVDIVILPAVDIKRLDTAGL